jgi:hypothetical protein
MSDGIITLVSWQEEKGKRINVVRRQVPESMIDRILALSLPANHFRDIEYEKKDIKDYLKEQKNESLPSGQSNPAENRANNNDTGKDLESMAKAGKVEKLDTGNRQGKIKDSKPSTDRKNRNKRDR